jgi:hypothetical protein
LASIPPASPFSSTFSERKLNIHDVSIHVYGEAAWAEFDWDFVAKLRKGVFPVTTRGMETQIYRTEASGWRLPVFPLAGNYCSAACQILRGSIRYKTFAPLPSCVPLVGYNSPMLKAVMFDFGHTIASSWRWHLGQS